MEPNADHLLDPPATAEGKCPICMRAEAESAFVAMLEAVESETGLRLTKIKTTAGHIEGQPIDDDLAGMMWAFQDYMDDACDPPAYCDEHRPRKEDYDADDD